MSPLEPGPLICTSNVGVFSSLWRGLSFKQQLPYVARMGSAISAMLLFDSSKRKPEVACSASALAPASTLPPVDNAQVCLLPSTTPYAADGYFTGIRSRVIVPQSSAVVYDSLAKNLHHIFCTIEECKDILRSEDCQGRQIIHRFVRIPFSISYFSGNIKMNMKVENNRPENEILFASVSQGRFLSKFIASFVVRPIQGDDGMEHTCVELDSKIVVKKLPPPPLKGLVKGIVIKKMHKCMAELANFHSGKISEDGSSQKPRMRGAQDLLQCSDIVTNAGTYALRRQLSTARREERPSLL